MPIDLDTLRLGLNRTVDATDFPGLGKKYEGKVRDNYSLPDGTRVLVTTDRISAFDRVLGTLPFKGQVLNGLSSWWFEATKDVAPSHVISVPDPNVLHAVECTPLPVELVVRSYLTGVTSTSVWTHYAEGKRTFAGHALPDGMKKNEPLPAPILTPSTKADKGGQEICRQRGLILVDTKYEMGKRPDGTIVVIDEIHTPDSSRYWLAASYEGRLSRGEEPESFDKEYVRRWLAGVGFKGDGPIPAIPDDVRVEASRRYVEACEMVRGEPFVVDLAEPSERMAANLVRAGLWKR
jgi:phosphoribosylaminoimidazole-succinocarboxamide synthase